MNFSDFLKDKRDTRGFKSTRELYEFYGGEKTLKISFRQFQNVENGGTPPTLELVSRIFNQEPVEARHLLVRSFFASHLAGQSEGASLLKYISKHLTQALEEGTFDWGVRPHRPYSESQMDFLIRNPDVMRFHRRLMLAEKVTKSETLVSPKLLKQMESLELVQAEGKTYKPFINRYRLPRFGDANPRMVSKSHEFIFKHVDLFLSKEGSPQQEVAYACQLVEPQIAQTAREQLKLLKEWIQSHVSLKTLDEDKKLVPLVFVGFCKSLDRHEIDA